MTVPLVLLAVAAVALGFLGTPAYPWLQARLLGESAVHGHPLFEGAGLMGLSIVLVALGIGAGWALYGRRLRVSASAVDPLAAATPGLNAALAKRLGFDELYAATFGRGIAFAATVADFLDRQVWGGAVTFLARLGEFAGVVNRDNDEGALNGGFDGVSESLRDSGRAYSRAQSGEPQSYLRFIAMGFVVLMLIVVLGGAR
jgi:NADH-quinone oxidoreductase subunit L